MTDSSSEDTFSSAYNDWFTFQKSMMDSWVASMSGAIGSLSPSGTQGNSTVDMYSMWSDMWNQNMKVMTEGASPILKATMEQFVAAQEYSLRYLDFVTRAWNIMSASADSGEDIQAGIEENRQQLLKDWANLPTAIAQDTNQLWNLYMQHWQQFGQPWMSAYQKAPEYQARLIAGDSSAIIELNKLYRDAYQQTVGRLVTSPNLGPAREFSEVIQQGFDTWVDWYMAYIDYQALLSETWQKAVNDFFDRLMTMAEKGESVESVRDLMLLWTRGAEEIFANTFREERYTLIQGKMLNSALAFRKQERMILEEWLNAYDLPTRSELDETHRRIYELRKEVKQLKKQLAEMESLEREAYMEPPISETEIDVPADGDQQNSDDSPIANEAGG